MKTKIFALLLTIVFCLLGLIACSNNNVNYVDYFVDNDFEVEIEDTGDYLSFSPKEATPKVGIIFYVGTAISPDKYTYLGNALAKQGYLFLIPKADMTFAYFGYQENEILFDTFKNVDFFIGGHSQGGGAAIRRADENRNNIKGLILFSPLAMSHSKEINEEETETIVDSISDTNIPTLLLEASEDHILSDDQKQDAKSRLPKDAIIYSLEGGCHMCFSEMGPILGDGPLINITEDDQHNWTINKVLVFLNEMVR